MLQKVPYIAVGAALSLALVAGCDVPPNKLQRGQELFSTCAPCHGHDGAGITRLRTPAIAGLPQWYLQRQLTNFSKDVRGAHPDDMEGHRMRPMARTLYQKGDVEAVSMYVSQMAPVPSAPTYAFGDTANGGTRFRSICQTCHGMDARGNEATGAPKLVGQWDWYMMAQLQKFHSGMRGTHPDDTFGGQMRAMSLTLEDTTAMHNVVAYVKTLPAQ